MTELGKLGTTTDRDGNSKYRPWQNPLLMQGVLGNNPMGWGANPMNPDTFATPFAAGVIASVVGGEVVTDPRSEGFNTTARMLAVALPDKEPVNAGAICFILGNDNGEYASLRAKSSAICVLLDLKPFDPSIAERIMQSLEAAR